MKRYFLKFAKRSFLKRSFLLSLFLLLCHGNAYAACSGPSGNAGDMMYNKDYAVMQYCDGTNWISVGSQDASTGGCSNPSTCKLKITLSAYATDPAKSSCTAGACPSGYTSVGCVYGEGTNSFPDAVMTNGAYTAALTQAASGFGNACSRTYAIASSGYNQTVCARLCIK